MTPAELQEVVKANGGVMRIAEGDKSVAKRAIQQGLLVGGPLRLTPWHAIEEHLQVQVRWKKSPGALYPIHETWVDEAKSKQLIEVRSQENEFVGLTGKTRIRKGSAGAKANGGTYVIVAVSTERLDEWLNPTRPVLEMD